MESVELLLMVASALLAGLGAYLFYDGHNHKPVAIAFGAVGFVLLLVSGANDRQEWADRDVDCAINRDCPPPSVGDTLWNGIVEPWLVEGVLFVGPALIGYFIAKSTRREPPEERKGYFLGEE